MGRGRAIGTLLEQIHVDAARSKLQRALRTGETAAHNGYAHLSPFVPDC
jgi:AraC-like DNA-binding protein